MATFNHEHQARLLLLLQERLQLLGDYLSTTKEQNAMLRDDALDASRLTGTYTARKRLLRRLGPDRQEITALLELFAALPQAQQAAFADISELKARVDTVGRQIQALDRRNAPLIERHKERFRKLRIDTGRKKEGVKKYTMGNQVFGAGYFDKRQ